MSDLLSVKHKRKKLPVSETYLCRADDFASCNRFSLSINIYNTRIYNTPMVCKSIILLLELDVRHTMDSLIYSTREKDTDWIKDIFTYIQYYTIIIHIGYAERNVTSETLLL